MSQVSKRAVLVVAGILGIVSASLIYMFLSAQAQRVPNTVSVVVAKRAISAGTVIDPVMLDLRSFPREAAPPGAASAKEAVIGKVCSVPIRAGEAVSPSSVSAKNRLSQMIPPFMRAVAVRVDPISGVGGFLKPGDHVDVVATFSANKGTLTKTVLQNVTLVAMGPRVVGDETARVAGRSTDPASESNVTLVVLPSDAEKLILADSKGKLRLTLRRADDLSRIRPMGITSRAMMGIVPPDAPEKKPAVPVAKSKPWPTIPPSALAKLRPLFPTERKYLPLPVPRLKPLPLPGAAKLPKASKTIEIIRGTKVEQATVTE